MCHRWRAAEPHGLPIDGAFAVFASGVLRAKPCFERVGGCQMLSHFDKFQCDQRVLVVKLLRSFDQFPSDSVAECAEVPAGGLVNEALCWGGGRTVAAFKKNTRIIIIIIIIIIILILILILIPIPSLPGLQCSTSLIFQSQWKGCQRVKSDVTPYPSGEIWQPHAATGLPKQTSCWAKCSQQSAEGCWGADGWQVGWSCDWDGSKPIENSGLTKKRDYFMVSQLNQSLWYHIFLGFQL